jgi:hypothetical protein
MTSSWNKKLSKPQVDEMSTYQKQIFMKQLVDEMTSKMTTTNNKIMKFQIDEVSSWWNDKLTK